MRSGRSGGRSSPVPDRRAEPRLPRLLRPAGVDRHLDRRAHERDLRVRLDAREDRHRLRRRPVGGRLGRGHVGAQRAVRRLQGPRRSRPDLLKQQWPAMEPLVEAFGYRNVRRRGLRGGRCDRLARRARAERRPAGSGDDRDGRPRRLPADRRAGAREGDGDLAGDHRDEDLRPPGGDRPLWHPARADPRLLRPQGRHLRQHPRGPGDRRQDRERADPALRLARGGARQRRPGERSEAQTEPARARRGRARLEAPGDRAAGPRRSTSTSPSRPPGNPTARACGRCSASTSSATR